VGTPLRAGEGVHRAIAHKGRLVCPSCDIPEFNRRPPQGHSLEGGSRKARVIYDPSSLPHSKRWGPTAEVKRGGWEKGRSK